MNKRSLGTKYENIAADFLKSKGYRIIANNYRTKYGEIDIIAEDGDYLCFVEVKFRSTADYGYPSEAVNYKKQRKIVSVSRYYCMENHIYHRNIRYDIVEIIGKKIRVLKDCFGG